MLEKSGCGKRNPGRETHRKIRIQPHFHRRSHPRTDSQRHRAGPQRTELHREGTAGTRRPGDRHHRRLCGETQRRQRQHLRRLPAHDRAGQSLRRDHGEEQYAGKRHAFARGARRGTGQTPAAAWQGERPCRRQ